MTTSVLDREGRATGSPRIARIRPALLAFALVSIYFVGNRNLAQFIPWLPGIELRILGVLIVVALSLSMPRGLLAIRYSYPIWIPLSFAWMGYMLASTIWSPQIFIGDVDAVSELIWLGLLFAVTLGALLALGVDGQKYIWIALLVVALVFALAGIVAGAGAQGRFAAFGGGPNTFVRVVIIGVIASIGLSLEVRRPYALLSAVPLLVAAAALSGSRGGIISGMLVTVLLVFLSRKSIGKIRLVSGVIGGIACAWIAVTFTAIGRQAAELVELRIVTQTIGSGDTAGRSEIYLDAWRTFLENRAFGIGAGGYVQIQKLYPFETHPHNIVLSTLSEGGIVGGALLGLAAVAIIVAMKRSSLGHWRSWCAITAAIFIFLVAQFSGYYYDFRLFFLFVAMGAILEGESRGKRGNEV